MAKRKKKNPFKVGIDHMLKVSGVDCMANIGGMPTTFKGIFDVQTFAESDGGGFIDVRETTLTVKRTIALSLDRNGTIDVRVDIDQDPLRFRISDIKETGDGSFSELNIILRTDVANDEKEAYDPTEFDD